MKIRKQMVLIIISGLLFFTFNSFYEVSLGKENFSNPKIEDLKTKSDIDDSALVNINDDYISNKWIVEKNGLSTESSLLDFDLIFKNVDFLQSDIKDLRIEFKNPQEVLKYRGQNIDVYGIYYTGFCQGEIGIRTGCMYGGVTPHEGNVLNEKVSIGINVFKDGQQMDTEIISTNKKEVTIQELDVKARTRINNDFKIYDKKSDIKKGFIKFHSHIPTSDSFYYDLYNIKGKYPSSYLQIYDDNKIINSSNYHVDVYLFTK